MSHEGRFPAWPPGFWRRIVLQPGEGWIGCALEDDAHSFRLRLDHADGRVTAVSGKALRHPWSACPGAIAHLRAEVEGQALAMVADRDPREHCTHLFDLAVLCAAHAGDSVSRRFDMTVADRIDGRTTAVLEESEGNGPASERIRWQLDQLDIIGPEPFDDRNLRDLSRWKRELPVADAERATLLRRAVFVSGARQFVPSLGEQAAEQGGRMGVCYNYQLPQAQASTRIPDWRRDFSTSGHVPLEDFVASRDLADLKETT